MRIESEPTIQRDAEKLWPEFETQEEETLLQRPSLNVLDEIKILKKFHEPAAGNKRNRRPFLFVLAMLLVSLFGVLEYFRPFGDAVKTGLRKSNRPQASLAVSQDKPETMGYSNFLDHLPPLTDPQISHMKKTLKFIYRNINPKTHLAYSHPGDRRLRYWSVIYDDAMRAILHMNTGDISMARKTIDYFIENRAIHKNGWVLKNGRKILREGWIVNIVDAAEGRPGGRGIEHIAHVGPNVYVGIASLHLYRMTGDKKYLQFARNRWELVKTLQNENPKDPNYGGIRMGPMGSPYNPQEQRLDFKRDNPSWFQFYNGEHAADFMAFCDLLYQVDKANADRYQKASDLIKVWDRKIYDRKNHLFFIGTTEVAYFEPNIGEWIEPGVVPIHPLDTTALKISAYGVDGLNKFEPQGAQLIRKAVDDHFKVTVSKKGKGNEVSEISGYDFVTHSVRKKLILYIEEGKNEDIKVIKGRGREPLMSDEWSTWVALADLRLAQDYLSKGFVKKAEHVLSLYKENALINGFKGAYPVENDALAYPYAQSMPYALNKPVGFGWNTHHKPFAVIGGISRTLGALRFDSFQLNGGQFSLRRDLGAYQLADNIKHKSKEGIFTEAELFLEDAWLYVMKGRKLQGLEAKDYWTRAAEAAESMLNQHPDWCRIAESQNKMAAISGDKYPLYGRDKVSIKDLEPLFRKYWALYHVGTAEFVRFIAYSELAKIAGNWGDSGARVKARDNAIDAVTKIIYKYPYAQAFDKRGWMWQPVNSVSEYLGFNKYSSEQYLEKFWTSSDQVADNFYYPLLKAINDTL